MAAAEYLAEQALSYWETQARRQGITPTSPVSVRWSAGPSDLSPATAEILDAPPARRPADQQSPPDQPGQALQRSPLPASTENRPLRSITQGVVTAWHDELYTRLGNDVLVVLGAPGAGKSGALLLLLLEALRRRHQLSRKSKVTVPV